MMTARQYRAGEAIEDHCRSCHEDRTHAIIAVDADGRPIRVLCNFCGSQHNYRGGPRMAALAPASADRRPPAPAPRSPTERERMPTVNSTPSTPLSGTDDLERLLRRVLREEAGWTPV